MRHFGFSRRLSVGWNAIEASGGISSPASKAGGAWKAAKERRAKAKREAEAERWIRSLRIGQALKARR